MLTRSACSSCADAGRSWSGAVLFVVASFAVAGGVAGRLTSGGFADPNSESERAAASSNVSSAPRSPTSCCWCPPSTDRRRRRGAGGGPAGDHAELARQPSVGQVASYWSLDNAAPLESKDGRQALVLGVIAGSDDHVNDVAKVLSPKFTRDDAVVRVAVGDAPRCSARSATRSRRTSVGPRVDRVPDHARPAGARLRRASSPPGCRSLVGRPRHRRHRSLALLGHHGDHRRVVFSLNLTTALGLGLAIDYSLFVVSRFREELRERAVDRRRGGPHRARPPAARSPFSALTVAISLAALLAVPARRSSARSPTPASPSSVLAALGAVVVLPALLAVLGHRVDSLRVFRHREPSPSARGSGTAWRRPSCGGRCPIATAAIVFLLVLGVAVPAHRSFGLPDDRVLPPGHSEPRRCRTRSAHDFTSQRGRRARGRRARRSTIRRLARLTSPATPTSLSQLPGVARVDAADRQLRRRRQAVPGAAGVDATASSATARHLAVSVVPAVEPLSAAGEQLVHDVRAVPSPVGPVLVGGPSAQLVDTQGTRCSTGCRWAALCIAVATFVLLFLMFGQPAGADQGASS